MRVCCAIIFLGTKVLAARKAPHKSMAGKWEFPGGKVHPGESDEDCIIREMREEMDLQVSVVKVYAPVKHVYPAFEIDLVPVHCTLSTFPTYIISTDHDIVDWFELPQLRDLEWADADWPIVQMLLAEKNM